MNNKHNILGNKTKNMFWSMDAIACYKLGCNCSKCNIFKLYFKEGYSKCMMKFTVINLVKNIGIPELKKEEVTL